ncbi:DEAD/DEAH box helicase [Deinococcus rubellus]|uniref:RNA helicase n=1 Tax=Deinococcus rubellus TaxID=1889240 RepID=A0ABY5YN91_9DEIO|nr:DEAD/DEAH box helicase [Deinococcus rubellus]UWX65547.1 DEAD/DEAH box helicase [Deinococcus rubellus]
MQFSELINPELAGRLAAQGITEATPIQSESLPHTLQGRDLIGRARTGTGKTLAFALPIIQGIAPSRERGRTPRALIMAPTRELAKQVAEHFHRASGELEVLTIYGGAAYGPQEKTLSRGVDIVVGTPGRIIDHIERGNLVLDAVQFVVLDEADEMLSVGFADAIEEILKATPETRQTMLFSATLTRDILRIAKQYQNDPVTIDLVGEGKSQAAVSVEHLKIRVGRTRTRLLADLLTIYNPERAIIFARTKREVDELALELIHRGLEAEALHGDLAQSQRERALGAFRAGRVRVLVATDVAARGLDIPEVDLVVQYHLPQDHESYVHRSGRTGRAGRTGTAIVMYGDREQRDLRNLEHATGVHFIERAHPTPKDVRDASARTSADQVRKVESEFAEPFQAEAERLFSELGLESLARALARIAGAVTPARTVSLLSGEEGQVTVMLHGQRMSVARTVALISRSTDIDSRALGRVRLSDEGAVADIPSELVQKLLAASPLDGQVEVSVPDELPTLHEAPQRERFSDSRSSGGYRGGSRQSSGRSSSNDRGNSGGSGGYRGRSTSTGNSSDFGSREFVPSGPERGGSERRDRR